MTMFDVFFGGKSKKKKDSNVNLYRVHAGWSPRDFKTLDAAKRHARGILRREHAGSSGYVPITHYRGGHVVRTYKVYGE